ncbi:uncharacterized protein N7500_008988 [Penicillium coprophilum]|uniref:uncharacterized protein n=1 Tax=Penicillium coprophilum TaxID=36646 RepID=UPI002387ECFC|nr:uncharacterized protein N7500_008988 [Penicillium coprophilum]KAJ5159337.1 hypothetical protein N7500_008988 [Penicillium coprophilum]
MRYIYHFEAPGGPCGVLFLEFWAAWVRLLTLGVNKNPPFLSPGLTRFFDELPSEHFQEERKIASTYEHLHYQARFGSSRPRSVDDDTEKGREFSEALKDLIRSGLRGPDFRAGSDELLLDLFPDLAGRLSRPSLAPLGGRVAATRAAPGDNGDGGNDGDIVTVPGPVPAAAPIVQVPVPGPIAAAVSVPAFAAPPVSIPGGFSYRLRSHEESQTFVANQVDNGNGLDAAGFPIVSRLSASEGDKLWKRVFPERADVGWREGKVPKSTSVLQVRAVLGQLIGHEAPPAAMCDPCARGNGPFDSCRVAFLAGAGFQWDLACACCQYSSAANKCSFRTSGKFAHPPPWLYSLVKRYQPSNLQLRDPAMQALAAPKDSAHTPAKKGPIEARVPFAKSTVSGKAAANARVAPTGAVPTPQTPVKKRQAPKDPVGDESAKKSKKRKGAKGKDRAASVTDVYKRVREVYHRVLYDLDTLSDAMVELDWDVPDSDGDDCQDSPSSESSADVLNKKK